MIKNFIPPSTHNLFIAAYQSVAINRPLQISNTEFLLDLKLFVIKMDSDIVLEIVELLFKILNSHYISIEIRAMSSILVKI